MNDLLVLHTQRLSDKEQILKSVAKLQFLNSNHFYLEKQRQRQKKENAIITHLKKANKAFTGDDLKKNFISSTIEIMNTYLKDKDKFYNPHKKQDNPIQTTQQSQKSYEMSEKMSGDVLAQFLKRQIKQKLQNFQKVQSNEGDFSQNNNFYQTYINLFVNFFNLKSQSVNPNSIKSIIRPNNRFVLIDLLKALLEFARHQFKNLVKDTHFYEVKREKIATIEIFRSTTSQSYKQKSCKNETHQQLDIIVDFSPEKQTRRVQTEPETNSPRNSKCDYKTNFGQISPTKHFRTKNSISSFLKHHSTQIIKNKIDDAQELKNRYVHANFIDANIKQNMYEKNADFVSQINMQKLQSKINNLYIELHRLNAENDQIITGYYEQNLGKKNKSNYDSRGLYSESQILAIKVQLSGQVSTFQQRSLPTLKSNSLQLTEYALQYSKYKNKCEQYHMLENPKIHKSLKALSNWLPLKVEFTDSIIQPLKIYIEETNSVTGEIQTYHWKKYKKQISLCDFLKQRVKIQFQRIQSKNGKVDKSLDNQVFKKKKFRKSLFLDNRKKMNELLQSNNVIFTKKESIFPVLKGIQQNYIKNPNMYCVVYQNNNALQNNITKPKDFRWDQRLQQRNKFCNSTIKTTLNVQDQIFQKQKRFDSIKKTMQIREKSQRKLSQTEKILEKLPERQKQKSQLLSRLSVKYDLPLAVSNRHKQNERYDKKNLISMSKIGDLRNQITNRKEMSAKTLETHISGDKKLTVLNV